MWSNVILSKFFFDIVTITTYSIIKVCQTNFFSFFNVCLTLFINYDVAIKFLEFHHNRWLPGKREPTHLPKHILKLNVRTL